MITSCVNCGAPLNGNKCEYCGTEYGSDNSIKASFGENDFTGTLTINGNTYEVYLGNMECHPLANMGKNAVGKATQCRIGIKHKFTLIEI